MEATITFFGSDDLAGVSNWVVGGRMRGRAGWFPSSYVEERQRIPASKVAESGLTV